MELLHSFNSCVTDGLTNGPTNGPTDGQTDGHTLLKRCENASKKIVEYRFVHENEI